MKDLSIKAKLILIVAAGLTLVFSGWLVSQFGELSLMMILILVFGGLVTYQIIRDPLWGMAAIVFFLPFERVPTYNIGGVDVRINVIIGLITLLAWLLALIANPKKWRLEPNILAIPLILFIASMIISLWGAANLDRGLQFLGFILFTMVFAILAINTIVDKISLNKIILTLFWSSLLVGLFGLFQFAGDVIGLPPSLTLLKDIYTSEIFGFPRIQAFSMEPLYFANYLLIPICLGLAYFFGRADQIKMEPNAINKFVSDRKWLVALLIVLLINFVLTVSRGAYLGFIAAIVFLFIFFFRKVLTWKNILIGLTACLLIGYGVSFALSKGDYRATNEFIGHVLLKDFNVGESVQGRLQAFRSALTMFYKHPAFGVGLANYGPIATSQPSAPPPSGWPIVNNEYIEILAETGLTGFLSFCLILIILIARSFMALAKSQDHFLKITMAGLLAALIGVLIQYNSFSTLYIIHIWVLIGLVIGTQNLILNNKFSIKS